MVAAAATGIVPYSALSNVPLLFGVCGVSMFSVRAGPAPEADTFSLAVNLGSRRAPSCGAWTLR